MNIKVEKCFCDENENRFCIDDRIEFIENNIFHRGYITEISEKGFSFRRIYTQIIIYMPFAEVSEIMNPY